MHIFWAILTAGLILLKVAGLVALSWWTIAAIVLAPLVVVLLIIGIMFAWAFK